MKGHALGACMIKHTFLCRFVKDNTLKRSPHLVAYSEVNLQIKKMNRETSTDVIKTLLAYGYVIEPVSGDTEQSEPWISIGC